jgi:hypothetical protein
MVPVTVERLAGALVALLAFPPLEAGARAGPQTVVALEYEIGHDVTGCPDATEFRASVARQLGYDPFRPVADKRVVVQIARREAGYEGRIRWTDARGRWAGDRRLSSRQPHCGDIAASVAFSVAVQVQLLAALVPAPAHAPEESPVRQPAPTVGLPSDRETSVVRAPPAAPETPPAAETPPAREPPAAPPAPTRQSPPPHPETSAISVERAPDAAPVIVPPPSPPAHPRSLRLSVGVGPSVALGMSPKPTGVGRLFVSGRLSWFSLELAADAALPATQSGVDGMGFSLDRLAAGAAACGHAMALAACLTTTLGRLQANGFGVDAPRSPVGRFSQVGARLAATADFWGHFFAAIRVEGAVIMSPWTVTLNQVALWTTPRVGALLGVDVGARFF